MLAKNLTYLQSKLGLSHSWEGLSFDEGMQQLLDVSEKSGYSVEQINTMDIEAKEKVNVSSIKMIALDVDGVMTDGGMYYTESGDEFKKYNTKDGMAIKNLATEGMTFAILSSGFNKNLILRRADLLGIEKVFVGRGKKLEILQEWCDEMGIGLENVAYIGDDINDHEIIANCGVSACPVDAIQSIREKVDIILTRKGGQACIREFVDTYIKETK